MRVPVILHSISGFDQDILESVALPTVEGLSRCIRDTTLLRNELTISPDFWSILQRLHRHGEAGPQVFELLQTIGESTPQIVTADNYESAISLANDFVTAGSVGSVDERQRDVMARRSKGVKPPKPRYVHSYVMFSIKTTHKANSENKIVTRGVKALGLIYHLSGRVPLLIQQSHLEEREGLDISSMWHGYALTLLTTSLVGLLVSHIPVSRRTMCQSLSRYQASCHIHAATVTPVGPVSFQRRE